MRNEKVFKFGVDIVAFGVASKITALHAPESMKNILDKYSDPCIVCGSIIAVSQRSDVIKDAIRDFYVKYCREWV